MLNLDCQQLSSADAQTSVAVRQNATTAASILSYCKDDWICVHNIDKPTAKPRRYCLPHLITAPQFQSFEWCKTHAQLEQEITDTVLNGRQVLVLCYGQSKLAKRDLLFGTGVTNFGICPNLVGSILKGIRTNSRRGKIECGFWMISNGALTDLVSASSSTLFDAEALKTVDVESVGDMVALLNEYFPVEKAEEDHNHLFVRLRVDTDLEENLRGEICLLDVAGFPSLVSGTADQKGLLEESPEAPMRCKLAIHQRELKEFCFIISRLAKRIDGYSIPSFHFRTIFGKLLQKLMTQSSVYGLCCISEEPLNVLNTIASLRIAVRMQKIKTDHHSPKRQSAVHSFTPKKSSPKESPWNELKSAKSLSNDFSESIRPDLGLSAEPSMLNDEKNVLPLQDTNRTLLNLLDKQKRIQSYLQDQLDQCKTDREELILQHQVEIQNTDMELQALRNKCRQLENNSPFKMQFEIYEQESRKNLLQVQNLKDSNSELAEKLAEIETCSHSIKKDSVVPSESQPRGLIFHSWTDKQLKKKLKSLKTQVASLKTQNMDLRSKERCYEFYK